MIITFLLLMAIISCYLIIIIINQYKQKKAERLQREQEIIRQTIKDYNMLMNHISYLIFWHENPEELVDYYYNFFSHVRLKNRSTGLLQMDREKRMFIDDIDSHIYDVFTGKRKIDLHRLQFMIHRNINKLDKMVS